MWLGSYNLFGLWLLLVVEASRSDDQPSRDKRFLLKYPYLWPNGVVPHRYESSALPYVREIERVIAHIEDQSCVRFPAWGGSGRDHLTFHTGNGCFSNVGYSKNGIRTSCCTGEACLHELGHALGFSHEQNSPDRAGWIDVNMQFIPEKEKSNYRLTHSTHYNRSRPYDISTMMHYHAVQFTKGHPAYSMDFPELTVAQQYFYHFKEMAEGYKCSERPQCQGRDLGCVHDGYQTIQHGKCRCVCPAGLDPDDKCRTPLRKVTTATWPKGRYALLTPKAGCPTQGAFKDGKVIEHGAGGMSSSGIFNSQSVLYGKKLELHFCTRTKQDDVFADEDGSKFNWPLGNYCIFRSGGKCPTGFEPQSFSYVVDTHSAQGSTPDVTDGNVTLCCQFRGFPKEPASFPTDKPFYLVKYPTGKCQTVTGMRSSEEFLLIKSVGDKFQADNLISHWYRKGHNLYMMPLCYYRPVQMMDCGGVILLSKTNATTTIEMSSVGHTDVECTWLVKGDNSRGTFVVDFDEFHVGEKGGGGGADCDGDRVEVRHAMIGQNGIRYCGSVKHSIRSITHKILIRFFSFRDNRSWFKAKVRWVPFEDMCYDVDKRGVNYDGRVNYTRAFEPCLPWADMTNCPHHALTMTRSILLDQLEGNACRNPDNSFRPWCYTEKTSCHRNYCDVCGLETPYDHVDYCAKLKARGFCTRDNVQAITFCAKTCFNDLPTTTPIIKYTEVTCGPPTPPTDGVLVGQPRAGYTLGDEVQYRCGQDGEHSSAVPSRCMTSGRWSHVQSACQTCPQRYHLAKDRCFALGKATALVMYATAAAICKQDGGATIATPRNLEEAKVIRKIANNEIVWIGVTDKRKEGEWLLDGGTKPTWTDWEQGEPNNMNNEDCAVMKSSNHWNDVPCHLYAHRFVCSLPSRGITVCHDAMGSTKCHSVIADKPSLCKDDALFGSRYCAHSCGHCDNDDVKCPVLETALPHVVALTTTAPFVTVGQTVTYGCARFKSRLGGDETRACMGGGKWSGQPLRCGDCPVGFEKVNDQCHGLLVGQLQTFPEAKEACRKIGGFVAMPKTKAESDVIGAVSLSHDVWIGMTDEAKENTFAWEDGSEVFWTHWTKGEPKHVGGENKDCVMMDPFRRWFNTECDDRKLVTVCTIPLSDDDYCYDMLDGGVSYDGHVNYTRGFEPCLPWAQLAHCPHNPFHKGDELDNLVGNACRNPDKSYRPWCYTDKESCARSFCDVCGNDPPRDKRTDCQLFKDQGLCQREAPRAISDCAATCLGLLPDKTPVETFSQIHCGPPIPPSDGSIVGVVKPRYNAGDTVEYRCKRGAWGVDARCMTSGQWSQTGYACPDCPIGFTEVGDRCFMKRDPMAYPKAVVTCQKHGGYVAVPRNEEEAKTIMGIAHTSRAWVGFSDEKREGVWAGDDGSIPEWTNWITGEPNGKRNENCVDMNSATRWNDIACTWQRSFVCAANKLDSKICQDLLPADQCPTLLKDKPTTCRDHPDFARVHCAKTCGICGQGPAVSCPAMSTMPGVNTFLPATQPGISPGQSVRYGCGQLAYQVGGDRVRACLPDGKLTGQPLECGDCPAGFELLNNACYGPVEGKALTFPETKDECKNIGGFVALARSVAENEVVAKLGGGKQTWLGLTYQMAEEEFVWEDGSPLTFENWAQDSPSSNGDTNNCVLMTGVKQWDNVECQGVKANTTVCTITLADRPLPPMESYKGVYYELMEGGKTFTYDAGAAVCKKMGGAIAMPTDTTDSKLIRKVAKDRHVWLAITDRATEGVWLNQDGGSPTWTDWSYEEPNDYGIDGEDCAVMYPQLSWTDMSCDSLYSLVCAIKHIVPSLACPKPTTSANGTFVGALKSQYRHGDTVTFQCGGSVTTTVLSRCMTNHHWDDPGLACLSLDCQGTYYNGYCYSLHKEKMTYQDAVTVCQQEGGVVATGRSQQEAQVITQMAGGKKLETWLGITNRKSDGGWKYPDGEKLDWTNWNTGGEPTNEGVTTQMCALRWGAKWLKAPCTFPIAVVCAKKLTLP